MPSSAPFPTRQFFAGPAGFVVYCSSPSLRDAVEALFADLPEGAANSQRSDLFFTEAEDGGIELRVGEGLEVPGQPPDDALAGLVSAVSRLALDAESDKLHLHCAALSHHDRGVFISAASGTGVGGLLVAAARKRRNELS